MAKTIAEKIIRTRDDLKSKRSTYKTLCDEACRLFNPEMEDLMSNTEGSEILQPIVSTGILAQERLTAGLFSNTMSMGRGNIKDEDPRKMKSASVKRFYTALGKETHQRIQTSPFPEKYNSMLEGFDVRGEGVMYVHFNRETRQHEYMVYPAIKCFPVRDVKGSVVEMYREYELSAQQAVLEFGEENVSQELRNAYDRDDYNLKFEFIHAMRPRKVRDRRRLDAQNMRFESVHIEVAQKKKVRVSGARRMRYLMPRFYVRDDEECGRSPAMRALPVARTLMKVVSDHMDGVEIGVAPPIFLPDKDAVESACLEAFGVNYCDTGKGQIFTYTGNGNLQMSSDFIDFLKEELNKLHYVDLFTMLEQMKDRQKTAYEISQLIGERIQAISPVVNRLSNGFFAPLYEIVAEDIIDYGLLNETIPPELLVDKGDGQGSGFRVIYTSRLDVQLADMEISSLSQAIQQAAEMVAGIEQIPRLAAAVKISKLIEKIFEAKNVDVEILYTETETEDNWDEYLKSKEEAAAREQLAGAVKPVDVQKRSEEESPADLAGQMMDENMTVAI